MVPRVFSQGSTCLDLLWIPPCQLAFRLRGLSPSLAGLSQNRSAKLTESIPRSEPQDARTLVWALPISLAATFGITCCFLFLRLYLDVSVHRVPFLTLWIGVRTTEVYSARFPHSEISGSMDICSSPKLFAAYHVLHRLLVPRHPPYALISITKRFVLTGMRTPLHMYSVTCVGNALVIRGMMI